MPKIVEYGSRAGDACVLLLGFFDGVHVGHRRLISQARAALREVTQRTMSKTSASRLRVPISTTSAGVISV